MIKSTFCHLPSINVEEEKQFWRQGIYSWDDLLCHASVYWKDDRYFHVDENIKRSHLAVNRGDIDFFLKLLPQTEAYRIYPEFANRLTFLDIETTGLETDAFITIISLLNRGKLQTYINSVNLESASGVLENQVMTVVSFYGTYFDIPRLRKEFPHFNPENHIDLATTFNAYGLKGELKEIARRFGCQYERFGGEPSSGAEAAEAWRSYKATEDSSILTGLVRYNQRDTKLLEDLLRLFCIRQSKRYSLPNEL